MSEVNSSLALSCTFKMVHGILQEEQGGVQDQGAKNHLPEGTVIDSKYRIVGLLGEGGMGIVYRAHQLSLKKDVALKTFRSADLTYASWERFQREAQAIAKLENDNIVRVFDFGIGEGNRPYYTMELLAGESLAQRIRRQGALPIGEALMIFSAVGSGLVCAHTKGVVHRDLKPENIFLILKGDEVVSVKLVDFGIAKLVGGAGPDAQRLTAAGTIFGSPLYMSPEQSLGQDTDERSDIYSLACALYETLTGLPPFIGKSAFATILSHQTDPPPTLADRAKDKTFPPWLESLISKMLAKKKEKRVQSVQEVLDVFSYYRKADRRKLPLKSAPKVSPKLPPQGVSRDLPKELSARDADQRQGNVDSKNFIRNAILVVASSSLALAAASYLLRVRTSAGPAQPVDQKPALPVMHAAMAGRYFKGIDNTRSVLLKVFKFPPTEIGYFRIEDGPIPRFVKCKGNVMIPVNSKYVYVPTALSYLKSSFFDGFMDDDLQAVDLDPSSIIGYNWDDAHLKGLAGLSGLRGLDVSGTGMTGAGIPDISKFRKLLWLDVSQSKITGQDLAKLTNLDGLQELVAAPVEHMSAFLKLVDKSKLNLTALNVKGAHLSDSDLVEIAKIRTLESLNLEDNQITAAGIKCLTALPQLHSLWLSGNNIGPDAIDTLGQIKTLKLVSLSSHSLGPANKTKLQQLLPSCRLDFKLL